jgi:hypothetical protein
MSRNFELMREMEGFQVLPSSRNIGPAFIPGEPFSRALPGQLAGDLTEDLVQQVFLQTKQKQPRMVVFAAVDHGSGFGCEYSRGSVSGRGKLSFPRTAQDVGHVESPRPYRLASGTGQYPIFCRADMERMPMAPLLGFTRGQFSQPFEIGTYEGAICRVTGDVRFPDRRCAAPITVRGCDRSGTTIRRNGSGSRSGVYSPEHGFLCSEEAALFQG